jgi:putative salt-induced outer membrane protein
MLKRALWVLAMMALSTQVFADCDCDDDEVEDTGPWSGKAALGYLATSGNTENTNLNAVFEVGYETGRWNHLFNALAVNASENENTTAEAYEWGWKSELSFSEFNYLFGRLNWRKDLFSSYDTQFSQTVGYGRRLLDSETQDLDVEIGAGARQSELVDGTQQNEFIVRAGLKYVWTLSDNSEFRQSLTAEAGQENTYLESVTALSATLVGDLALVASYTIKHNTDVLPGLEKTDTWTALSLEYHF